MIASRLEKRAKPKTDVTVEEIYRLMEGRWHASGANFGTPQYATRMGRQQGKIELPNQGALRRAREELIGATLASMKNSSISAFDLVPIEEKLLNARVALAGLYEYHMPRVEGSDDNNRDILAELIADLEAKNIRDCVRRTLGMPDKNSIISR